MEIPTAAIVFAWCGSQNLLHTTEEPGLGNFRSCKCLCLDGSTHRCAFQAGDASFRDDGLHHERPTRDAQDPSAIITTRGIPLRCQPIMSLLEEPTAMDAISGTPSPHQNQRPVSLLRPQDTIIELTYPGHRCGWYRAVSGSTPRTIERGER